MIDKKRAEQIIQKFHEKTVLVVGDLILDRYLWGDVERISPEAPVPVVEVKKETVNPGGASNVAWNISSLGSKVYMAGVIGEDQNGKILEKLLVEKGIIPLNIKDRNRPTTEKTRIIAVSQQLLRIDRENKQKINSDLSDRLIKQLKKVIQEIDCIIISDYGKGVITEGLMDYLKKTGKPLFVDPKPSNFFLYKNVTTMTPNRKEAYECVKADRDTSIEEVGKRIMEELEIENLLITLGPEGMALFDKNKVIKIPAKAKKVFDVTGAGDTVISVLALSKISGASWEESASLANYAAGYVVGEIGTATVDRKKLLELIP